MAPILAVAEQYPIAVPLTLVGYTSGVYTYKTWNPPVAKARMMNRNKVRTSLQWKGTALEIQTLAYSLLYSHQSWVFITGELNNVCVHLCGNYTFTIWFISQCMHGSLPRRKNLYITGGKKYTQSNFKLTAQCKCIAVGILPCIQ